MNRPKSIKKFSKLINDENNYKIHKLLIDK